MFEQFSTRTWYNININASRILDAQFSFEYKAREALVERAIVPLLLFYFALNLKYFVIQQVHLLKSESYFKFTSWCLLFVS